MQIMHIIKLQMHFELLEIQETKSDIFMMAKTVAGKGIPALVNTAFY